MSGVTSTPVDVAILCRGTADVAGCAASVRAQGPGGLRTLIVSDGGENDQIACDLAASRPDLVALPHDDASAERRWAAGLQAPFLLTLSAGQRLVAGAFDAALALMTSRPDVVAGFSRCAEVEETASPAINDWRIDDGLSEIRRMCGVASAPLGDGPVIVRSPQGAPFGWLGDEGARLGAWLRLSLRGAIAECAAPLPVRAPAEVAGDGGPLRSLNARREAFGAPAPGRLTAFCRRLALEVFP
jgi:hypothetical protein